MLTENSLTNILSLAGFAQVRWRCYSYTCKRSELCEIINFDPNVAADGLPLPKESPGRPPFVPTPLARDPLFRAYVQLLQGEFLTHWQYQSDDPLATPTDSPVHLFPRGNANHHPPGASFINDSADPDVRRELWVFISREDTFRKVDTMLTDLTEIQSGMINWDSIPDAIAGRGLALNGSVSPECRAFYRSIHNLIDRCLIRDAIYRVNDIWVVSPTSRLSRYLGYTSSTSLKRPPSSLVGFTLDINPISLQILLHPQFYRLNLLPVSLPDIVHRAHVLTSPLGEAAHIVGVPDLSPAALRFIELEWSLVLGLPEPSPEPRSTTGCSALPSVLELRLLCNNRTLYYPTCLTFVTSPKSVFGGPRSHPDVRVQPPPPDSTKVPTGPIHNPLPAVSLPLIHPTRSAPDFYWNMTDPFSYLFDVLSDVSTISGDVGPNANSKLSEGQGGEARPVKSEPRSWSLDNDLTHRSQRSRIGLTPISTPGHLSSMSPQPAVPYFGKSTDLANLDPSAHLPTAPSTVETTQEPSGPPEITHGVSRVGSRSHESEVDSGFASGSLTEIKAGPTPQSVPMAANVNPTTAAALNKEMSDPFAMQSTMGGSQNHDLLLMDNSTDVMLSNSYGFEDLDTGLDVTEDDFSFFDDGPAKSHMTANPIPRAAAVATSFSDIIDKANPTTHPLVSRPASHAVPPKLETDPSYASLANRLPSEILPNPLRPPLLDTKGPIPSLDSGGPFTLDSVISRDRSVTPALFRSLSPYPPADTETPLMPRGSPINEALSSLVETKYVDSSSCSSESDTDDDLISSGEAGSRASVAPDAHLGSDMDSAELNPDFQSKLNSLFDSNPNSDSEPEPEPEPWALTPAEGRVTPAMSPGRTSVVRSSMASTPSHRKKRRRLLDLNIPVDPHAPKALQVGSAAPSEPAPRPLAAHGLYVILLSETQSTMSNQCGSRSQNDQRAPSAADTLPLRSSAPVAGFPNRRSFLSYFPPANPLQGRDPATMRATPTPSSRHMSPFDETGQTVPSPHLVLSPLDSGRESLSHESFLEVVRILCQQAALGAYMGPEMSAGVASSLPRPGAASTHRPAKSNTGTTESSSRPSLVRSLLLHQDTTTVIELQHTLQGGWARLTGKSINPLSFPSMEGEPIMFKGPLSLAQLAQIPESSPYSMSLGKSYIKKKRSADSDLERLPEPELVVGYHYPPVLNRQHPPVPNPAEREHTSQGALHLQADSTILPLWEKLQLSPVSAPKDITYFALVPCQTRNSEDEYLTRAVTWYLKELSISYQTARLGTHAPGQMDALPSWLVPVVDPVPSGTEPPVPDQRLRHFMLACERLGVALRGRYPMEDLPPGQWQAPAETSQHIMVYLINPSPTPASIFELCNCIRMLQAVWRNNRKGSLRSDTQLNFQILNPTTITRVYSLGSRVDLRALAFSVYTKCYRALYSLYPPSSSADTASTPTKRWKSWGKPSTLGLSAEELQQLWGRSFTPPITLARSRPTQLQFSVVKTSLPFVSPIDSNTTIHLFYSPTLSGRWVLAVWIDVRGQMMDLSVYENTSSAGPGITPPRPCTRVVDSAVLAKLWLKTRALDTVYGLSFKFVISRIGSLGEAEWLAWDRLLGEHPSVSLLSVYPKSTFFALANPADPAETVKPPHRSSGSDTSPLMKTGSSGGGSPWDKSPASHAIPGRPLRRENSGNLPSKQMGGLLDKSNKNTPLGARGVAGSDWHEHLETNSGSVQAFIFNHQQLLPATSDACGTVPPPLFSKATGYLLRAFSPADYRHSNGGNSLSRTPSTAASSGRTAVIDDSSAPVRQFCTEIRMLRPSGSQAVTAVMRETLRHLHQLSYLNHWSLLHNQPDTVAEPSASFSSKSSGGTDDGSVLTWEEAYGYAGERLLVPSHYWRFMPLPIVMLQRIQWLFAQLESSASD
ncbi:mediator of RNA polymerase II transcription subunit 13 [Dimargaris cristalligena]|nr:mediator of RNA polymerase II transcription subunit 13 [Dimargaris cristalligena]